MYCEQYPYVLWFWISYTHFMVLKPSYNQFIGSLTYIIDGYFFTKEGGSKGNPACCDSTTTGSNDGTAEINTSSLEL